MAPSERTMGKLPEPLSLGDLPVEILVKIIGELDMKHALHIARTSKRIRQIYEQHSAFILLPILSREFSPLEDLLRIPDVSPKEFEPPFSAWRKRRVYFAGALISGEDVSGGLPEIHFRQEHVPKVMEIVKTVSRWESAFPRLRFAELSEERRRLRPHERERLRGALYTLWRYATSFHQHCDDFDATRAWARRAEQADVRCNSLRTLTTLQLYQLQDLWKTVCAAVTTQLCPSVSMLVKNEGGLISEAYLERRAWGDGLENDIVIANVLRLRPDHLLDLLDFVAAYPTANRHTLMPRIRSCHPTVEKGHETLSFTLGEVIRERMDAISDELGEDASAIARFLAERNFPTPLGGILDDDFALQEFRTRAGIDGGGVLAEYDEYDDVPFFSEPLLCGMLDSSF